MPSESAVLYELPDPRIALLTLNRPDTRNAQDTDLLYELNDAFDRAARDPEVKVIILAANGPHFSSGHDLRESDYVEHMSKHRTVGTSAAFAGPGAEAQLARESEIYVGFCERWRTIPKPTIAQVQGKCIAGGLMLAWPCDLIVAADDAEFMDNTVELGVGGVEFFAHPYELGPRKAKEMLFTSGWIGAEEALRLGMVSRVVPRANLAEATLELARVIANKPALALRLAKEAVNAAVDASGRPAAQAAAFAMHHLAHWHNHARYGVLVDPSGISQSIKKTPLRPEPGGTDDI